MSVGYRSVLWNKQKKQYDIVMLFGIIMYLMIFVVSNLLIYPNITVETLIIRATGSLALIMLHIILMIGPLSRLNQKFLPLLYNRRHLGVTMFLFALVHGMFCLIQFHGLGNVNPLLSLFTSNTHYGDLMRFPFQVLGFLALMILMVMAATSHDFWLRNLGPKYWKALHMSVYFAYALLIMHVMLGIVQYEQSLSGVYLLGIGMLSIISLHISSALWGDKTTAHDKMVKDGFFKVCAVGDIVDSKAKMVLIEGENIAIFKYDGKLSAINNVCKHQNGPLGEGKVVDGCVVCPWHGYQYHPENGCSPPPFKEKVATYDLQLKDGYIYVNPKPYPEGTKLKPIELTSIH